MMFALLMTYKKHEKNAMKGLMGALLMAVVLLQWECVQDDWHNELYLYLVADIILFASFLSVFANHILINTDHHSNPAKVRLNQILIFISLLLSVIQIFFLLLDCLVAIRNFGTVLWTVFWFLSLTCIFNFVICIESKLDAFRLRREDAGWTEVMSR